MPEVWTNESDWVTPSLRMVVRHRPLAEEELVCRFALPADAALLVRAPLLRDALAGLVACVEGNALGEDLCAELTIARELLASIAKEAGNG